jgi:hypothetical protein
MVVLQELGVGARGSVGVRFFNIRNRNYNNNIYRRRRWWC